jgi:hypothetical protein
MGFDEFAPVPALHEPRRERADRNDLGKRRDCIEPADGNLGGAIRHARERRVEPDLSQASAEGARTQGQLDDLGYGMSLYGSIEDGKFTLYRPDRKPAFLQGESSGANLVFTLYGHPATAHPETEADGCGPPKYIAPPTLHKVPSNGLAMTPPNRKQS